MNLKKIPRLEEFNVSVSEVLSFMGRRCDNSWVKKYAYTWSPFNDIQTNLQFELQCFPITEVLGSVDLWAHYIDYEQVAMLISERFRDYDRNLDNYGSWDYKVSSYIEEVIYEGIACSADSLEKMFLDEDHEDTFFLLRASRLRLLARN